MTGTFATKAIITNGLHCGPACQGLITTRFSLYCKKVVTPPSGGGGPYPGPAWNKFDSAQDIYTPVEPDILIPWEDIPDPTRKHVIVTLKINIGDIKVEKIYKVAERRQNAVVKIFNMLDVTQSRFKATISGLKRVAIRAKAFITNLKLK